TRWWAGRDNAILSEPTSSHANCLKTRREASHHASPGALCRGSSAPWHDGGRSFSTKERFAVYTRIGGKWRFFKKKAHFWQFPGDVLRTLCWAAILRVRIYRISIF